ncbi:MAG: hypothetical protein M1820_000114 [Bogoriella megaspora]|nr:MAG: hypothetical protein M1820_000114 [Bogoriella megaspora]
MPSPPSYTRETLSYPINAAEFDPYSRNYLIVGGGGGEGRTGVGNKITVLDVSSRSKISTAAAIDLSKDEDSVTSIANLSTRDGVIIYAGINSSAKDREAGINEHFRSFEVKYPPRKRQRTNGRIIEEKEEEEEEAQGSISLVSKTALFRPTKDKQSYKYQRITRLSPVRRRDSPNKRVGAIATGLAPEDQAELIIFNATVSKPEKSDIISRIQLEKHDEAGDIDIVESEESNFRAAYNTDYSIFLKNITYDFTSKRPNNDTKAPNLVYSVPISDRRPKLRALRFLTNDYLLALANFPSRSGAELLLVRTHETKRATVVLRKKLPSSVKAAIGLDICALDADVDTGDRQIVVAVAGQDISVHIFTLDYIANANSLSPFHNCTVLRDLHPTNITQICFEPFHSPVRPSTAASQSGNTSSDAASPNHPNPVPLNALPQYLRLASTSMGGQVVVDTFPLTPVQPTSRSTRYILSTRSSHLLSSSLPYLVVAFAIAITAILLQSVLEAQGVSNSGSMRSLLQFLPPGARQGVEDALQPAASVISQLNLGGLKSQLSSSQDPSVVGDQGAVPEILSKQKLADLVQEVSSSVIPESGSAPPGDEGSAASPGTNTEPETRASQAVIVREHAPDELRLDVHPNAGEYLASEQGSSAKKWEDLEPHQQAAWREKLVKAGHWALEEGDTVLRGILFSEWAGIVGEAARAAMEN